MNYFLLSTLLISAIGTLINKGPHTVLTALFLVTCFFVLIKNQSFYFDHYKKHAAFYLSAVGLLIYFILSNLFHFGFSEGLYFAIKRIRWVIFILLLIPSVVWLSEGIDFFKDKKTNFIMTAFVALLFLVSSVVIWDSIVKFLTTESLWAGFFSETKNNNPGLYGSRASWTYNPIHFSRLAYFFSLLFLGLSYFYKDRIWQWLTFLYSIGFLSVVFMSQTRASFLGFFASVLAVLTLVGLYKNKKQAAVLCSMFFLLATIGFYSVPQLGKRAQSIYKGSYFSKDYRIETWKANAKLIKDNPILGVGNVKNRTPETMSSYLDIDKLSKNYGSLRQHFYNHPHNTYLDIGSASGIPALLLFLFILLYPIIVILRRFKTKSYDFIDSLSLAFLSFTLVVIFFEEVPYYNWFIIILAMSMALRDKTVPSSNTHSLTT